MFASILQIGGLLALSLGIGLIYLPAGIIAGGLSMILVGLSLERIK